MSNFDPLDAFKMDLAVSKNGARQKQNVIMGFERKNVSSAQDFASLL